jgi:hypothetical protein
MSEQSKSALPVSNERVSDDKGTNMLDVENSQRGRASVGVHNQHANHFIIDVASTNTISSVETPALDTATQPSIKKNASINRVRSGPPRSPNGRSRGEISAVKKDVGAEFDATTSASTGLDELIIDQYSLLQDNKLLHDISSKDTEADYHPKSSRSPIARGMSNDLVMVSFEDSKKVQHSQTTARLGGVQRPSQSSPISSRSASRSPQRTGGDAGQIRAANSSQQSTSSDRKAVRRHISTHSQSKSMTLPGLHWELPSSGCLLP